MVDSHASSWFRFEYEQLRNKGLTGDELRLAMYEKGVGYLKHIAEGTESRKKDLKGVIKMIEYSQGWIDRFPGTGKANIKGYMVSVSCNLYGYLLEIGSILDNEHLTAERKLTDVKYKMEALATLLNDE